MIYFASDFHLGVDAKKTSHERELLIVKWLDEISKDATDIFLVGDIFDFWFEYKNVIPKGYIRLQGKLAELKDRGINIEFFIGNHDMWMFDYFEKELQIPVHREPIERTWGGVKFLIGHGDGLGPGDHGYKMIKKIFASKWAQWLFAFIHPSLGIGVAHYWSRKSRDNNREAKEFLGPENEWLAQYSEKKITEHEYHYLIFGHRHLPIDYLLSNGLSRYINLGEWLHAQSYGQFDGERFELKFFENKEGVIYG